MCPDPAVWFLAVRADSGVDRFTERLCAALVARGIEADITWLPLRAEYAPYSVAAPKPPPWANIVHVNSWLPPRFLPHHLPVVSTLHSCVHDPALTPYKTLARRLYHARWIHRIESDNLRRADCVVAVSHYTAERAKAIFGLSHIDVIQNGIDTNAFYPVERSYPNRLFRLLYVGNWSERKGVDRIAPIMEMLGTDFELYYTADRKYAHRRYPLPGNCHCIGRLGEKELVFAYQQADALLFPSRLEGMPLTVLEAQACGLPVIAANVSTLPELIVHGQTGLLCPRDDVACFVGAARQLSSDLTAWREMRRLAAIRVNRIFCERAMVERWISTYTAIIEA